MGGVLDRLSHNPVRQQLGATTGRSSGSRRCFGTGSLPHRATTLGLPGLVTVVLLVVTCLGRRPAGVLLAGILAALLAPFHFYRVPRDLPDRGPVRASRPGPGERGRSSATRRSSWDPVILALPFIADAVLRQGTSARSGSSWVERGAHRDGPLAVLFFYATNLGIPFALAVVAGRPAKHLPDRWFLVAWLVAIFVVPNVIVVVSSVEFDMNKYFQINGYAVAILAAWLIRRWTADHRWCAGVAAMSPGPRRDLARAGPCES